MSVWAGATVLITGGTGSFGGAFTELLLRTEHVRAVRIYSRDEFKQSEMAERFGDDRLRFLLGDVRDKERLYRALDGVDVVVHAAAMKQVPAAEYNPLEAVKTNVIGTANVIDAALDRDVQRVMALSTDKACSPLNLYGATKAVLEKLVVQANAYTGSGRTRFACVRYGNVLGSRGSVVQRFLAQRARGRLSITDRRMTRFAITLEQATSWIKGRIEEMAGGELFIPKIPSLRVVDLAAAIAPECELEEVGIRPGEKLHEQLLTLEESRRAWPHLSHFTVAPDAPAWQLSFTHWDPTYAGEDRRTFEYRSDTNDVFLDVDAIRALLGGTHLEAAA